MPLTGVHRSNPNSGAQTDLGADGTLAAHDLAGDRSASRSMRAGPRREGEHVEHRGLQDLGEARHMQAGTVGGEIGDHRELAIINGSTAVDLQMNDPPDPCHAGAIERESNFGLLGLPVGLEMQAALAAAERFRWPLP